LKLPIAMGMAKVVVKSSASMLTYEDKFCRFIDSVTYCDCCGPEYTGISGPKGTLKFSDVNREVAKTSVGKPIPNPVRTVKIRIANIDAALKALRDNGFTANMTDGLPVDRHGYLMESLDFVDVSVNASARRIHETLLLAGLVKPVGTRDRKFLSGMRLGWMSPAPLMTV